MIERQLHRKLNGTLTDQRFVHLDFEVDMQEWSAWAIQTKIRPEVIAFLRFRPALLSAFDRDNNAFPSPRSWEFVSRILISNPKAKIEHELIAGAAAFEAARGKLTALIAF